MRKVLLCCFVVTCSGCFVMKPGVEVGAKVGVYGVDEKKESQSVQARSLPVSCYIWWSADQCGPNVIPTEK